MIPVLSLLLTAAAWQATKASSAARVRERYRLRTAAIETSLRQRLANHESLLRGVVGLFDASDSVTLERWTSYLDAVRPENSTPGLQRLGFTVRVLGAERARFEERMRTGNVQFRIWPDGARNEFHTVVFIHPFAPDLQALGFDMFTETVRREAMVRALERGAPTLTSKVRLLQETGDGKPQPGVLLYLPVYQHGNPLATVADRRAALHGFVYGVFRVTDLMNSIFGGQFSDVDFEIHDGVLAAEEKLLYRSAGGRRLLGETTGPDGPADRITIEIAGQRWLLLAAPSPAFFSTSDRYQHWLVAGVGIAVNLLLGIVWWASAVVRKRALVLAEGMADAVRFSDTQTQLMVDSITDHAIFRLDAERNVASWNSGAERVFAYTEAEALGQPAARFWVGAEANPYFDVGAASDRQRREGWHTRKDGHRFWGVATIAPLQGPHHTAGYVVILRDETKHREAMEALAETSAALEQRTVALGRFNRLAAGRELRMIELKRMVNERSIRLGMPAPFDVSFANDFPDAQIPGEESF
jgi:PAS domain S-box-containing protein